MCKLFSNSSKLFLMFFFRYPITVKKYINDASKNASYYEAIFIINTN